MSKFVLTAQLQLQPPSNVGQVVKNLQSQLNSVNVNVKAKGAQQAQKQIQQLSSSMKTANKEARGLGDSLQISVRRFAGLAIATRAVSLFTNTLGGAIRDAISFERQLVKISQVTGKTIGNLRDLTNEITRLSTTFGVAADALLNVSRVLSQAGLNANQTKVALDALAKSDLAPTFDDITQTAEGAVAIFNQFKQGAGALEGQLGSLNAVAGQFAVEAGDLIAVIRRTGGVFKQAGGDLNELIALFTSVRSTTRESAESIATGLRTIFTRIQRPETIKYLKQFGVQLTDLEGKFIGPYKAVGELSKALAGLEEGDLRFVEIAEQLGGFRQIGKVLPLIKEYSVAQRALAVAQAGSNSLAEDAAKAQQTLAVRIQNVAGEFAALVRSISETGTFQAMANTALVLASALIKIGEAVKPLIPLLGALAAIKLVKGMQGMMGGMASMAGGGKGVMGFNKGGVVPGSGNGDTVPAMLTPGEFVIKKSSVQKLGASTLQRMNNNKYAGGGKIQAEKGAIGGFFLRPEQGEDTTGNIKGKHEITNASALAQVGKLSSSEGGNLNAYANSLTKDRQLKLGLIKNKSSNKYNPGGTEVSLGSAQGKKSEKFKTVQAEYEQDLKSGKATVKGQQIQFGGSISGFFPGDPNSTTPQIAKLVKQQTERGLRATVKATVSKIKQQGLLSAGVIQAQDPKKEDVLNNLFVKGGAGDTVEGFVNEGIISAISGAKMGGAGTLFDYPSSSLQGEGVKAKLQAMFGGDMSNLVKADAKRTSNSGTFESITDKLVGDINKGNFEGTNLKMMAAGGPVGTDTVPALLTPGEFVVNRASAKKIGYGSLNRMNKVAKYADGGVVQKFAGGTTGTGVKPVASSGIATAVAGGGGGDPPDDMFKRLEQEYKKLETDIKSHSIVIKEANESAQKFYQQEDQATKSIAQVDTAMIKLADGAEDGAKGEKAMKRLVERKIELETKREAAANKAIAMEEKAAVFEGQKQKAIAKAGPAKQQFMAASQSQAIRSPLKGNIGNSGGGPPTPPSSGGGKTKSPMKDNDDKLKKNSASLESMFMGVMAVNSSVAMFRPTIDATSGALATGSAAMLDSFTTVASQGLMVAAVLQKLGVEANASNFAGLFQHDPEGKKGPSRVQGKIGGLARSGGESVARRFGAGPEQAAAFGQSIGSAAQAITPFVAALGTSVAAVGILNSAITTFYNYQQKLNKAVDEGDVSAAGDAGAGQAQLDTANNARSIGAAAGATVGMIFGPVGAIIGGLAGTLAGTFTAAVGHFFGAGAAARNLAEANAGVAETMKSLEKDTKEANKAMQAFKDGNGTAVDVMDKFQNSFASANQNLERTSGFATAKGDVTTKDAVEAQQNGVITGSLRNAGAYMGGGLFGMETNSTRNDRIKEQGSTRAKSLDAAEKSVSAADPAISIMMRQAANAGQTLEQFKGDLEKNSKSGRDYLETIKRLDAATENGEGASEKLATQFKNIAEQAKKTRAAIEAMTLGMASVNGAANAAAMGLNNYLSSQEAGFSTLANSMSVLENGVTGAANSINTADFNSALGEASGALRGFGATEAQISKFEANMKGVNAIQRQLPASFEKARGQLQAAATKGIGGGETGTSQKDAVIDVLVKDIKGMNLGAEVEKNILAGIENMDLSQAELQQIELGNFDVLEKKIGDIGGKQLEQVRNAIQKQIEMQKKLNAVVSRRLQLEDQYVKAQQRGISMILEMQEIQAKHGGAAVSPAMREQAAIDSFNKQSEAAGVTGVANASPDQILRNIQDTRGQIAQANETRMDAAGGGTGLSGDAGVELNKNQERLNNLTKAQYDLTKNLISIKQQELSTIKEKNKLERDAMDALIGGDVESFMDNMATQSAQAAIATGDTAAMNMMGGQAIGRAAQENKRLQDAGVTEMYGQKLGGPGGLTERGFQAVANNVGIADDSFAKSAAGTTLEETALDTEIRNLAANLKPLADSMVASAQSDLEVGKAIEDGARKLMKAGEVLESAGKALGGSDVGETAEGGAGAGAKSATVKAQTANINVQKVNSGGTGDSGGGGGIVGSVSSMATRSPSTAFQAAKVGVPAAKSAATSLRAGYDMSKMGMSTKNMTGLTKAGGVFQRGSRVASIQAQKAGAKIADFGGDVATKAGKFGKVAKIQGQRVGLRAADMASDAKAGFNAGGQLSHFERSMMSADDVAAADKVGATRGGKIGAKTKDILGRGKDLATKTADRVMGAKNVDKLASRTKGLVDSGRSMAGRVGNSKILQGGKDLLSNAYKGGKGFVGNVSQGMKYAKVANQMGPMGATDELVRAGVQKTVGGRMGAGAQKLMTKGTDLATKYAPGLSKGIGAGGKFLSKALGPGMAVADLAMGAYKGATSDSNVRAAKDEEGNVVGPGLVADRVLDKQSTAEKGVAGMLTGSATVGGSISGSLLGVEEGGTTDQVMAGYESMGRGAAIGASIGSFIPGAGTAVGAGVGAVVGGGAEVIKSAGQLRVEQKAAAESQAKTESMRTASVDDSGLDVLERNKAKEQARLQDEMAVAQSSGNTQEQEKIQARMKQDEETRRNQRKENRSYFSAFTDSIGATDTTADSEEYKQYQESQRTAGASPAAAGAVPAQKNIAATGQVAQAGAGGVGLDPELLNKFSASLEKFNTDLSANIDRLENTKLEIKLADTNVSVNINDGGVLQKLTQLMGDVVSQKIEEKLAETRQNPDGSNAAPSSSQLSS